MDVKQIVTDKIIEQLEKGVIPWKKPWWGGKGAYSRVTGKSYSYLNQMLLEKPGEYLTFNQIKELGGTVKKGEKSKMVVFWTFIKPADASEKEAKGEEVKLVPFLKYYNVFHIDQTEGIEKKYDFCKQFDTSENTELEKIAKDYFEREHIRVVKEDEGNTAAYSPALDIIRIPSIKGFVLQEEYYSTLYHEMTHSTGHKSRLAREGIINHTKYGDSEYAKEELIAELGSASLLHITGFETNESFTNSAAYINSWLKALKNDKNLIITAAGKAEKAVAYIMGEPQKGEICA